MPQDDEELERIKARLQEAEKILVRVCHQATGAEPDPLTCWHRFISAYEMADEYFARHNLAGYNKSPEDI